MIKTHQHKKSKLLRGKKEGRFRSAIRIKRTKNIILKKGYLFNLRNINPDKFKRKDLFLLIIKKSLPINNKKPKNMENP